MGSTSLYLVFEINQKSLLQVSYALGSRGLLMPGAEKNLGLRLFEFTT